MTYYLQETETLTEYYNFLGIHPSISNPSMDHWCPPFDDYVHSCRPLLLSSLLVVVRTNKNHPSTDQHFSIPGEEGEIGPMAGDPQRTQQFTSVIVIVSIGPSLSLLLLVLIPLQLLIVPRFIEHSRSCSPERLGLVVVVGPKRKPLDREGGEGDAGLI